MGSSFRSCLSYLWGSIACDSTYSFDSFIQFFEKKEKGFFKFFDDDGGIWQTRRFQQSFSQLQVQLLLVVVSENGAVEAFRNRVAKVIGSTPISLISMERFFLFSLHFRGSSSKIDWSRVRFDCPQGSWKGHWNCVWSFDSKECTQPHYGESFDGIRPFGIRSLRVRKVVQVVGNFLDLVRFTCFFWNHG